MLSLFIRCCRCRKRPFVA